MIKKNIYLFVLLAFLTIVGCTSVEEELSFTEQFELRYPQEVGERRERRIHADRFNFWTFSQSDDGMKVVASLSLTLYIATNPNFNRDFVVQFVSNEFEALNYISESVVPVWPSRYTERIVYSLNHFIREEGIETADFNLQYPITIADLINSWEDVRDLYENFDVEVSDKISTLSFYINRILSTMNDERIEQLEYAIYWRFQYPFIERPVLESTHLRRSEIPEIARRYAWYINEHGLEGSEIIFVLTMDEAIILGSENFVLDLPETATNSNRLANLNTRINDEKENINLGYFLLAYPITKNDLVNNWEGVNALMNFLDN